MMAASRATAAMDFRPAAACTRASNGLGLFFAPGLRPPRDSAPPCGCGISSRPLVALTNGDSNIRAWMNGDSSSVSASGQSVWPVPSASLYRQNRPQTR